MRPQETADCLGAERLRFLKRPTARENTAVFLLVARRRFVQSPRRYPRINVRQRRFSINTLKDLPGRTHYNEPNLGKTITNL